jgi:diapolycopene oxygenase
VATNEGKRVVVIGAGLGGISAAISLASKGFAVVVCEKNAHLGGKLNLLETEGFSFDLGPSIIILPHLFRRLWERAGRRMEDHVEFEELQPQWRCFYEDGVTLDLHSDMRLMEAELRKLGPAATGYWSFMEHSRTMWEFAERHFLENGADTVREIVRDAKLLEVPRKIDLFATMHEGVVRHVREPHLVDMLDFFIKYVGSSAYDAPGLMNLLQYSQLGFGLWYVRGGMYALARGLGRLLADLGVEVRLGAEVTRILEEGGRAVGVRLLDGREVRADFVVSNMEVIPAYERLLDVDAKRLRRLRHLCEPAASGLVVHLGVKKRYPQLQHHNFFFSRDVKGHLDTIHRDKRLPEDPTIYLVCPTRTDGHLAPADHEIIKILPHIPAIQDVPFTPDEYAALEQRVYEKLERMGLEGLRANTVVKHVLVPEDLQRMYYSNRGAIYGVVAERNRNFSMKAPKQSTLYRNLYFVGGSVNPGGGTPMVVLCGQQVAERIAQQVAAEG